MNIVTEVPKGRVLPSVNLLADSFPVISQTFVMELASALRTAGVPLRVLATGNEGADRSLLEAHPSGADLLERAVQPTASPREIVQFLKQRALQGRLPLGILARAALRPSRAKSLLGRATAFATCPHVDVLHCQFTTLGNFALKYRHMGLLRFSRLVVHIRGWDISMYVAENGRDAHHRVFAEGDFFIANCQHFADRAIELGCDPDRIVVIGSPIDTDRFSPPGTTKSASATLRIGAVGRLVEKKGFDDLVEAMAILRDKGVSASLDIIGDGPMRHVLEKLIDKHDLSEIVKLRGAAPSDGVLAMLQRIDLFVAPSVRAKSGDEDAPVNTLKEAMATGLPVIGTRHGGIPELVKDGINGLLVPERDPAALAKAMAQMAATPADVRTEMGRVGRLKVIAEYARPVIAERTIDAYNKALNMEKNR